VAALTAVLVVVVFNFVVEHFSANLPPQVLLKRIRENAPSAQTIFLGNSQIASDVDPAAFSRACSYAPVSLNLGMGFTYASEHCLVLEYLLPYARSADTIIYGFFDTLPTDSVPAGGRDLVGNRALAYLFPDRASALLAPGDRAALWRMRLVAHVPMIRERAAIWAKVERVRRRLSGLGLPPEDANRFGRAKDFTAFEPADRDTFEARLRSLVGNQQPLNDSVREIVRLSFARHLKFYLIEMPMPAIHRQRFYTTESWPAYQRHVQNLIESGHGHFIDASDWVADENFIDALHLNENGAALFSARLAREICQASRAADFNHESPRVDPTTSR
jgi:hypothetical protein